MSVNSRLKAIQIIGQRKAFYRQRIPESSSARKKTVDIDILVISRNCDRIFMQSINITSRPPSRIRKWNQWSQFRSTSAKVIRIEDLSYQHFNDEPRIQEKQQVKDQQSCTSNFVAYPTNPSSNQEHQTRHDNSIPYKAICQI